MEVLITEIPGGYFEAYQCPFCSKLIPAYEVDSGSGEPIRDSKVDCPRNCPRCGSPMDIEKAKEFEDKMAAAAATLPSRPARRTVKV